MAFRPHSQHTVNMATVAPAFDFWSQIGRADAAQLRARLVDCRIRAGQAFIRAGEPGDCLYFLRQGQAEVRRQGVPLAQLAVGQIVGEMALLDRHPRNADVVAVTDCQLSRLSLQHFDELCDRLPNLRLILTHLVAHRLNWSGADVLARRIGPYEIVQQLGAGNMGWVFRAVRGPDQFAIKMLPHPLVHQPGFLERHRREAQLLRQIAHAHIVQLHDLIELYGTAFLVLEYIHGRNAQEWTIQLGRPAGADIRRMTIAVASALQAAHAAGVLHCDIKPGNIMLRMDGVVKLVDFGIAASTHAPADKQGAQLTPGYAAPEQFDGQCRPASDFYSLGVTAYELLTGQLPFNGTTLTDWARLHQNVPPPLLSRDLQPADLVGFIQAALIKHPGARLTALQPFLRAWAGITEPLCVSRPPVPRAAAAPAPPVSAAVAAAMTVTD